MMFLAETLKSSHASTKMEFVWQGNIFVVPHFRIHTDFTSLQRDFSLIFGTSSLGW